MTGKADNFSANFSSVINVEKIREKYIVKISPTFRKYHHEI